VRVVEDAGTAEVPRYELVDVDSHVVEILRHRGPDSFLAHFGDYRPSVEPRIGIGARAEPVGNERRRKEAARARFPNCHRNRVANSATIPEQVVGRDGTITVPYAGRIAVAGHAARDVQTVIEHALEGKAIQPQVLVNVPHSVSNTVTVTGEVANGARVPLSVKGDRVMNVIAAAGGIRAPVNET
jgi:polysaccharide biosynthesis/export protein